MLDVTAPTPPPAGMRAPWLRWLAVAALLAAAAVAVLALPVLFDRSMPNIDRDTHFRWLFQFREAIESGEPYPRWLQRANLGLGEIGYSAYIVYWYLSAGLQLLGLDVWSSVQALAVASLLAMGLITYGCVARLAPAGWAVTAALLMIAAPFPVFLVTHYSAFPWSFSLWTALAFIVLSLKPEQTAGSRALLLMVTALMCLAHVLVGFMALVSVGAVMAWQAWRQRHEGGGRRLAWWCVAVGLGVGLVAFQLLPSMQTRTLLKPPDATHAHYLDWHNSFTFPLVTSALYGQRWFSVQWLHSSLLLAVVAAAAWALRGARTAPAQRAFVQALLATAGVALVLSSELAYPVYQLISPFRSVQWPYRFLCIASVAGVLAAVATIGLPTQRRGRPVPRVALALSLAALVGFTALLQWQVLRTGTPLDRSGRLLEGSFQQHGLELTTVGPDWRRYVDEGGLAAECRRLGLACTEAPGTTQNRHWIIETPAAAVVRLPLFDSPTWRLEIDGQAAPKALDPATGLITAQVPAGRHTIGVRFVPLSAAGLGSAVSAGSALVAMLLAAAAWRRRRRPVSPSSIS